MSAMGRKRTSPAIVNPTNFRVRTWVSASQTREAASRKYMKSHAMQGHLKILATDHHLATRITSAGA